MTADIKNQLYFLVHEVQKSLDTITKKLENNQEIGLSLLPLIKRVEELSTMARRVT